jgi:hypothetical protein
MMRLFFTYRIVRSHHHLDHAIYLVGLVCVQCTYTACLWAKGFVSVTDDLVIPSQCYISHHIVSCIYHHVHPLTRIHL